MGFLFGDNDDESPLGQTHESTWGNGIRGEKWSPDEWDAPKDDDGKAPWERKGKSGAWSW